MSQSGMHDFNFLFGSWDVAHRRLVERLVGSHEWETFSGSAVCRPILGGVGNLDEFAFPTKGFMGATLRLYDPERAEWSLYWSNSRTGRLEPPVVGVFVDGVGDFYGEDVHDGVPIRVHYRWSEITPSSARWEQAFSTDNGSTWEANWVMDFRRTADLSK
jgi:hypothetical protein